MQWWIQGKGPGTPSSPPPLIPLIFQTKLRPEGPRKFFLETFPPPPPRPPLFEGLDPLLSRLISLVHSKNQAANQMTYHDVIRLQIVWIVGALARVHQLYAEKTTERVSDQTAQESSALNLERY